MGWLFVTIEWKLIIVEIILDLYFFFVYEFYVAMVNLILQFYITLVCWICTQICILDNVTYGLPSW